MIFGNLKSFPKRIICGFCLLFVGGWLVLMTNCLNISIRAFKLLFVWLIYTHFLSLQR